jgi:hypothetical protein
MWRFLFVYFYLISDDNSNVLSGMGGLMVAAFLAVDY